MVKVNRWDVKRYGCTCLVSRVVYITILHSLGTESLNTTFHRCVSRNGYWKKIYSGNGRNIVGHRHDVYTIYLPLHHLSPIIGFISYAMNRNIDWHLNPPMASHMREPCVWMQESARRFIEVVVPGLVRFTDEILEKIFAEVEFILNCRTLVEFRDDPNWASPSTSNYFFLLRKALNYLQVNLMMGIFFGGDGNI